MNCEEAKKLIEALIEGDLNQEQKKRLDEHIHACLPCRKEYEQYLRIETVLGECLAFSRSPEQAAEAILSGLSHDRRQHPERHAFSFWKIAAGFLLAAGLLLGFYTGRQSARENPPKTARAPYAIQRLAGTVLVKHPNSVLWHPLTPDSAIFVGDQFLSAPNAHVTFAVDKHSFITLSENSMLVLNHTADKTELHLEHGSLDAYLGSPHGPFFVTTPHGRAEALGTEFSVTVE